MKVAYFGIDMMLGCLKLLHSSGHEIAEIFTIEDGGYDSSRGVCSFAREHGIPLRTSRATAEDIEMLERSGVEMSVTAGYPWLIPLSAVIKQVNIHPAYLPVGRGAWPMPVCILRGIPSGITLHKLSDRFDEGDIIMQEYIPFDRNENLETLNLKIYSAASELLGRFLLNPLELWSKARPQPGGEYWDEPTDADRTISQADTAERASLVIRAFYGFGCLCKVDGVMLEIPRGEIVTPGEAAKRGGLKIPVVGGVLVADEYHPYFRNILLSDRERVEAIRAKYPSALSDFTFALIYCWRKALKLGIYLEDDFFAVRGDGYYFCPVGSQERVIEFVSGLLSHVGSVKLRFCDSDAAKLIGEYFGDKAVTKLSEDDSDYLVKNRTLEDFPGCALKRRRNDIHHYSNLVPPPEVEDITPDNLRMVAEISRAGGGEDSSAESEAIKHFSRLGLRGVLVRRGDEYVGFAIASVKTADTLQGHFSKCIDRERGGGLFTVRACSLRPGTHYVYTNMEDDMGDAGLRNFKRELHANVIPSYTIGIEKDNNL